MTDIALTEIIDGLIDKEARDLHESLRLGLRPYRNGEENQAAARVITVIPPDQVTAVLGWLVSDEVGRTIACRITVRRPGLHGQGSGKPDHHAYPAAQADKPLSVLIRLCARHTDVPYDELLKLLLKLSDLADAAGPAAS